MNARRFFRFCTLIGIVLLDVFIFYCTSETPVESSVDESYSDDYFPSWSKNASKIVFDSDRDGNYEIYVMNPDGSGQTNLSNNSYSDIYPSWSLDGSKILFQSDRSGNWEIYVMNSDGTNQTNISNNSYSDMYPSWFPDVSKIAFQSN